MSVEGHRFESMEVNVVRVMRLELIVEGEDQKIDELIGWAIEETEDSGLLRYWSIGNLTPAREPAAVPFR